MRDHRSLLAFFLTQLRVFLLEGVRHVFQENQSENDMFIFRSIQISNASQLLSMSSGFVRL
jgi:hypothetical protein